MNIFKELEFSRDLKTKKPLIEKNTPTANPPAVSNFKYLEINSISLDADST